MRYYIADSHFFHQALNSRMDMRGFEDIHTMNTYMIEQWNKKVRKNDEVVILGDFSWGKAEETNEIVEKLNGRLYLIEGNHDAFLKSAEFKRERFAWIQPYAEMNDNKRKVILCHYPIMCYNGQYRRDNEDNPKTYMLYGHVHDTYDERLIEEYRKMVEKRERETFKKEKDSIPCNLINCFCKYSDYIPLTLDEWIENDRQRREKAE